MIICFVLFKQKEGPQEINKSRTKKVECFCKVQSNINDIGGKRGTIRIYSSGVKMTLKVGSTPMEITIWGLLQQRTNLVLDYHGDLNKKHHNNSYLDYLFRSFIIQMLGSYYTPGK